MSDAFEAIRQELLAQGYNCTEIVTYANKYQRFSILDETKTIPGTTRPHLAYKDNVNADIILRDQIHLNLIVYTSNASNWVRRHDTELDLTDPTSIPRLLQSLQSLLPT